MLLKVSRLGVIKEAEIDLDKNLIIFCGPNNSGKTYLAYTIHGIHFFKPNIFEPDDTADTVEFLTRERTNEGEIDLFLFLQKFHYKIEHYVEAFNERLPDVFATNRKIFQQTKLSCAVNDWEKVKQRMFSGQLDFTINLFDVVIQLRKEFNSTTCAFTVTPIENKSPSILSTMHSQGLDTDAVLLSLACQYAVLSFIFPGSFIAPTERTAVNIFSKELSIRRNELVDQLFELNVKGDTAKEDPLSFLNRRAKRYTLPIRTSLEISEDMAALKGEKSEFAYLADHLEQLILNGRIDISKEGELYFTPNKSKGKKLGLHLTASMVKSLSSLVFYFRHLARQHEFIIIDEPELNLHPDNQRKIARFLAKVVNAGFKVLISTHSDYIIRELNNLIMLNQGTDEAAKLMDKFGYDKDDLLDNRQVGVYLFNDSPRKGVEEIEVTESGFEVESIDKTIHDLNESSQEIYLSLF